MEPSSTNNKKLNLSLDMRAIILILLAIIFAMLLLWKPWSNPGKTNDRTVEVTGEAIVSAEPDEYVFYPSYQFKNSNKEAALKDVSKKSTEVVAKLKELGVNDNKIKTNSSGHEDYPYYNEPRSNETVYNLSLTITLEDKDLAQKVQDYLLTTSPQGVITPQATFSQQKRKELESKARDIATKDARAKADQSAKNLGFKVGTVKEVKDGAGFNYIYPTLGRADMSEVAPEKIGGLELQPGENELNYSVKVIYFVK